MPADRLDALLRDARRHRDAIREYGLAGYVTMVEQHRARLLAGPERIRRHCEQHGLELPSEVVNG